mmetsp:Transcript_95668/g.187836  ORF Transcript_95668/g.187836 Transcript_95668/m.187836 type:complete len:117 (+) Transcript_95668:57-407(+)
MLRTVLREAAVACKASPLNLRPSYRAFGSMKGAVKFFDAERGFGFIQGDGGKEYFVHHSGIESSGFKSLADGEEVEFDVHKEPNGKQRAVKVTGPGGAPVKGSQRQPRARSDDGEM